MPGRAIKATRLSNRLQPRATRSLRASLVHSLDQSPVHGGTVNKELLRTVTNTTRAAQQGAWATRFDAGQAGGECRRQATTDRARPTDGRNGPNGSAPQCVQRCAASPIHANRRLCSEDQPAQLRTRSQQPTGGQQSSTPAGMRGPPQPQVAPYVMLCAKHRAKNGVFTWPCSKQCRQMSTRPWAKCTRRASWHCVVHSQINPPSRAKDGARGARASTSSRLAAGVSHTQHAARSGVRSHE